MKKLHVLVLVGLLTFALTAKAIAPILIAEGVELILASGEVATLPAATAAGVSAAWTGVVTGIGSALSYMAFKDATGAHDVRIPVSGATASAPPAPSAPSTAAGSSSYVANTGLCGCSGPAASTQDGAVSSLMSMLDGQEAWAAPHSFCVWTDSTSFTFKRATDGSTCFQSGSVSASGTICPAGYSVSSGTCVLTNPRQAVSDGHVDVLRSDTTLSFADDIDGATSGVIKGSISGDTFTVAGQDSFGNPVSYSVQAQSSGQTLLKSKVQTQDANANSVITEKALQLDSSGRVMQSYQLQYLGNLSLDGQTGTVTPAPSGSLSPSGSQITFPNDYNRENTQQAVLSKLGDIHTDLTEQKPTPDDPVARTSGEVASAFFPSTFSALTSWQLPVHAAACPVINFDAFGQSFSVNSHCALIDANAPLLGNAFLVIWTLAAMFVVLRA